MSFWGATVITNLLTALPVVGPDVVYWLWGGFSVGNATLNRFFSIHYLLPFVNCNSYFTSFSTYYTKRDRIILFVLILRMTKPIFILIF